MKNVNKIKISPDEIYGVGQNKKSWFPAWNVLDDKSLYEKVNKLAHSTFCGYQASGGTDPKKFTKSQNWSSGIITDDGIASGFSTSNYLTINDYISGSSNWIMEFEGTLPVSGEYNTNIFGFNYSTTSNSNIFLGRANEQDDVFFDVIVDINGTPTSAGGAQVNMTGYANAHYKGFVSFNGTQYIASFTFDDGVTKTISINSTYLLANTGNLIIGYSRRGSTTIDLKQFSITVDGVEVFSGNKTGIDTIKLDEFKIMPEAPSESSVVVSPEGIASGFAVSNFIRTSSVDLASATTWEVLSPYFKISDTYTSNRNIFNCDYSSDSGAVLYTVIGANSCAVSMRVAFAGWSDWIGPNDFTAQLNTFYQTRIVFDGSTYKFYYRKKSDYRWTSVGDVTKSTKVPLNSYIGIGANQNGAAPYINGELDLNAFKVIIDGNLVYQPCLKIPYTEAKLNHKVVDVVYRDRVKDLFEQFSYNGYHTIDEDSENFTLPTHDFDDIIDCYEGEGGSWEQTVGQVVKQQGLGAETGVEVTLLKPYKDADSYALSIPYTDKTASSFVPAADGDWFAKGKVVL